MKAAAQDALEKEIDEGVEDGRLSEEDAERLRDDIPNMLDRLVRGPDLPPARRMSSVPRFGSDASMSLPWHVCAMAVRRRVKRARRLSGVPPRRDAEPLANNSETPRFIRGGGRIAGGRPVPYYRCPACGSMSHSVAAYSTTGVCAVCSAELPDDAKLDALPEPRSA